MLISSIDHFLKVVWRNRNNPISLAICQTFDHHKISLVNERHFDQKRQGGLGDVVVVWLVRLAFVRKIS